MGASKASRSGCISRKWISAIAALVLVFSVSVLCLSVISPSSADDGSATSDQTPVDLPASLYDASTTAPGPRYDLTSGLWMAEPGITLPAVALATTGGPDDFGYTWDDSVTYNWIDATTGTDTGMSGSSSNQRAGPFTLPFTFRFYENTYSTVYIAASGFLAFTDEGTWPSQSRIPDPARPNNVVAPYWAPGALSSGGTTGRAFFASGGSAPNRYFVAEWYRVGDTGSMFTFEAILWENGDIDFQYQTIVGTLWCWMIGIEDSAGVDSLAYRPYCQNAPTDGTAVRFRRPATDARISATPRYQGRFARAAESVPFQVLVRNTGDLGADTLTLSTSGPHAASLFAADGATPLSDTDGDGVVDTGLLPGGAAITVTVRIQMPDVLTFGRAADDLLTVTSSRDSSKSRTVHLQAAIPASFAQIYADYNLPPMLALYQPTSQQAAQATTATSEGLYPAVAQARNGHFVYVWSKGDYLGSGKLQYNLRFAILDECGAVVRSAAYLTNNTDATMSVTDATADVAVTPDGRIGILWQRERRDSSNNRNLNVYFTVLDSAGNIVLPTTNLTNNNAWGGWSSPLDVPEVTYPRLAATDDNRFVVSWRRSLRTATGSNNDIFFAVRDSAGAVVKPITRLTDSYTNGLGFGSFTLAPVSGNRALFAADNQGIVIFVVDSQGNVLKGLTRISAPGDYNGSLPDAAQMADGSIAVAWTRSARILYTILDNTATQIAGPTALVNSAAPNGDDFVSVSASGDHAVLTWGDADPWNRRSLYYALVDSGGALVAAPMVFHTDPSVRSLFRFSQEGHGNAPYSRATRFTLTTDTWGGFASAGRDVDVSLQLSNLGNLSASGAALHTDTFELAAASSLWPVAFYAAGGVVPLADTNGDGQPDTGPVTEGDTVTVVARLQVPAVADVGDSATAFITVTSSVDTTKQRTVTLQSAIPAPFVQAYGNEMGNAVSTLLVQPAGQAAKALPATASSTFYHAVAEAPNGNLVRAWSRSRTLGSVTVYEVEYAITNRFGEVVAAPTRLTDESGATNNTYNVTPGLAATPDGNMAIVWYRYQMRTVGSTTLFNYNVFAATVDEGGRAILPPTNLTGNTAWGASGAFDIPLYFNPRVSALAGNQFMLAWNRRLTTAAGLTDDVIVEIIDSHGAVVRPATPVTQDTPGPSKGTYTFPSLATLANGTVFVAMVDNRAGNIVAMVLDSSGNVVKPLFNLTTDGATQTGSSPDAAQLSDGKIVVAWQTKIGAAYEVRMAVLDAVYNVLSGPTMLANMLGANRGGYPSLAADAAGHAVITWPNGTNLYYALVDGAGVVLTPPLMFKTNAPGTTSFSVSNGYGNTSYSWLATGPDPLVAFGLPAYVTRPGGQATTRIVYANHGLAATGVALTVTKSAALEFGADTSGLTRTIDGDNAVWQLPDLGFLHTGHFSLNLSSPSAVGASEPVTVTIGTMGADLDPTNNTGTSSIVAGRAVFLPVIVSAR